ncbi:MAG: hypothetical protein ACREH6_12040 [Geminicoccaceae bacterium]
MGFRGRFGTNSFAENRNKYNQQTIGQRAALPGPAEIGAVPGKSPEIPEMHEISARRGGGSADPTRHAAETAL